MSSEFSALLTSRIRLAVAPLVLFGGNVASAADTNQQPDQLHAATHRQVRVIEPKVDGKTPKLHTIATTSDGHLLAAVGGQSMQYVRKGSGYETKFIEEPGFLLLIDSEGQRLKQWRLDLTPTAIAVTPDGSIYVGGSGKVAKLSDEGSVSLMVDSPHVGSVAELRKKTAESIRTSRSRMSESFASQIETLRERVDKIEVKEEEDRSRLEEAQLKAFKTQLDMLERLSGSQDEDEADVDDSQIDAAVLRTMSITSMAASDKDVFVCAMDPDRGGYSIWRMDRDLDSSELIMDGLRGCCGQMDIQCCGENLLISENTKFRVGIYDRNGRTQGSFGKRDRTSRAGFGSCCNPMNSMAMPDGTILTAESSIGHIKRFDEDGKLIAYIGKATIGAGCKHCALGYDEQNDLYYMMYQDKNAICVLANSESAPVTLAERQLQQRKADFFVKAAGHWALKEDERKKTSGNLFGMFGGGRGGSSQYPVSSLKLSADGSAKILEGMYKVYGDKSQLELLEGSNAESDAVAIAMAIDQVPFLEGTWEFEGDDVAILTFQGRSPITLARSLVEKAPDTACAGEHCENDECEDESCPRIQPYELMVAAVETERSPAAPPEIAEPAKEFNGIDETMMDERFLEIDEFESQIPKATFEYKLVSKKELGKQREARLNEMGADGWEFCGQLGKRLMFKRMSGFEMAEAEEE